MSLPLEDYALIGDTQTAALVGIDGSIDWLCWPRFDSGACFAALLGERNNGRWRLAAKGMQRATRRRYVDNTLVLETEWETPDGLARVTDFMPLRSDHPDLTRMVEGVRGEVAMEMDLTLALRLRPARALGASDRRRSQLRVRPRPGHAARRRAGQGRGPRVGGRVHASRRGSSSRSSCRGTRHGNSPHEPPHAGAALDATLEWWRGWAGRLRYEGPGRTMCSAH